MSEEHLTNQAHGGHGEHAHGDHGHGHAASPFTQAELDELQKSDIGAGAAVIVLMSAIFGIGLVLYTVIAFIVA